MIAPATAARAPSAEASGVERSAIEAELRSLERLARLMDTRFRLPLVPLRFGLDGLLGLVPVIGDGLSALPALYLIARGRGLGAPAHVQGRMAANVAIDLLIGAVPLVGDIVDFGFKANSRNVALLREHFATSGPERGPSRSAAP